MAATRKTLDNVQKALAKKKRALGNKQKSFRDKCDEVTRLQKGVATLVEQQNEDEAFREVYGKSIRRAVLPLHKGTRVG